MNKIAKLGPFRYKVVFQESGGEEHGETDVDEKVIRINTRFSKEAQRETLLHELMHVAYEDCPLFKTPLESAEDMEEALIRKSSPNLFMYLSDNDWLRDFIFPKKVKNEKR